MGASAASCSALRPRSPPSRRTSIPFGAVAINNYKKSGEAFLNLL